MFTFLLLQVLSISLLVRYNKSQQAKYMEISYELTGRINKQANGIAQYFSLAKNNRLLAEENTRLKNELSYNFINIDTSKKLVTDTVKYDTTGKMRKYFWRTARVVGNSVNLQNNYIQLERGSNQGIEPDMAVVSAGGVVGVVTDVYNNYSLVMSLLHRKSNTSVMLKKDLALGNLSWDGVNPQYLQATVPRSSKVVKGDTLLTSFTSSKFPPGLMAGTVAAIDSVKGGNDLLLQIKPGANFFSLQYVDIIGNALQQEQREMEDKIKKYQQ